MNHKGQAIMHCFTLTYHADSSRLLAALFLRHGENSGQTHKLSTGLSNISVVIWPLEQVSKKVENLSVVEMLCVWS